MASAPSGIAASIYDIEKEIQAPSPSQLTFPQSVAVSVLQILASALSSPDLTLVSDEFRFDEGTASVHGRASSHFSLVRRYPALFSLDSVVPMANRTAWLVLFGLLKNPPAELEAERDPVLDALSLSFTSLRDFLTESPFQLTSNPAVIFSQIISAILLTFLFNSFSHEELPLTWSFVARLESDVRNFFVGFRSPEMNSFHKDVFALLSSQVQKAVPRKLGAFQRRGPQVDAADLLASFSHQRRCQQAWADRRRCLFKTAGHSDLITRSFAIRGSTAPAPARQHTIRKGTAERSTLDVMRAAAVLEHADATVAEHRKALTTNLQDLFFEEENCLKSLRRRPVLAHPLRFSFKSFQNRPTKRIVEARISDEDRNLSPSELVQKQCAALHDVANTIARKYSEMWDSHTAQNRTAPEVLHEYFGPVVKFHVPPVERMIEQ
jgi:hypothetical protein